MSDGAGRLLIALGELRAFLRRARMTGWDERLQVIEHRIADPATMREGLRDLEQSFGGMGSLNDIFVCAENGNVPPGVSADAANKEADRLLDAVFRELALVGTSPIVRLVWRWCEWWYRGRSSPRINKAFGAPRR